MLLDYFTFHFASKFIFICFVLQSSQIQEYANSTGKCFGKTSYIRVNAVDGCDVFKRGEKSLIAFKGEQSKLHFYLYPAININSKFSKVGPKFTTTY